LQEYDYAGATAIAVAMLVVSFVLLLPINILQRWSSSRRAQEAPIDTPLGGTLKPAYSQKVSQ
jgi:hypothetical protein